MLARSYYAVKQNFGSSFLRTLNVRFLSINVAIVGSGPAGFYTTQKLLKNPDINVDIYEKLPVPFGLVRYGVAPDHAEVKNVINSFTNIAQHDRVNFYGNVGFGEDISLDELLEAYHAVVLCYGSAKDKLLNIEGEQSKNTISARNFVGWYNGLPEDRDLDIDLNCDTACIIGQGNVALDCARILLKPSKLERTDITRYSQDALAKSKIKRIYIIGRRGPLQVSFTTKELRELIQLNDNRTCIEPSSIFKDTNVDLSSLRKCTRQRRRLTELLLNLSTQPSESARQLDGVQLIFKFLSKPNKIIANQETSRVEGLELNRTGYKTLDDFMNEGARPDETEILETIDCGLIIRSIGYQSVMLDKNLPSNPTQGSVLNTNGKVHGYTNLYCSGWLATGASGVIAGTLNSSQITAQTLLEDVKLSQMPNLTRIKPGSKAIMETLTRRAVQVVHFNEWLRIDELEKRLGVIMEKPREKLANVTEMLRVASGHKDESKT